MSGGTVAADRLAELYACAEADAARTADWYLAARVWKRRTAWLLRCGTFAGAAGGAVLPLVGVAGRFGCLSLLGAVAALACDRYLGLTSGWMRDVATAQAVRERLAVLRYDWAAEGLRDGLAEEAAERRLGVLRQFSEDVTELVRAETADWMREFHPYGRVSAGGQRRVLAADRDGDRDGGRSEADTALRARFLADRTGMRPGMRPGMPRQRPPENGG
ncbi:SLATT domain-containing protein [Streptomyces johnsoniae]|uniref:SLATT domain-containing protein n=1 Tax=Streptomyces johnsoniae TaxID=3075532 RepID=A0ABU2S8F9_9ACTN|nr:SLATT domain-containing protein [Streptomyces sp. DSM 41886]MDT0445098.1 SLATT domain-containing protein [Streptomyces sp. DSM 41886]